MGIFESKNNTPEQNRNLSKNMNINKISKTFKQQETIFKINRTLEGLIQSALPMEQVNQLKSNIDKSICKIKIKTETIIIQGTGFLLSFYIEQERFYCLISNEHIIKTEFLNKNIIINIICDDGFNLVNINLNNNKRYMKSFIDNGLDITIVETLNEDNISKNYYLYPEKEERINNELINNSIYILQ